MKIKYLYWTKTKGIRGKLKTPEDFIVKEIINPKFLLRYKRENKIEEMSGPYSLFLLKKKNLTTEQAISKISKIFSLRDFGYAGLKDRFAVTYQYVTVKGKIGEYSDENIEISDIRKINRPIAVGDLIGNEFIITLHDCKLNKINENVYAIAQGIPNYFGPQRFGKNKNNHVFGKLILQGIDKQQLYDRRIDKKLAKFFIHAYQSYIFNETVNEYIRKNKKPYFKYIPVVGYNTKLGNSKIDKIIKKILKKEKINIKDFKRDELRICCNGSKRKMFIRTKIDYKIYGNDVILRFFLPKGSYATNILREIQKSE